MEVVTGPDFVHTQTLNRLVEQYQTDLLRMCYLYLHDAELARDAVQETYLKAYRALDSFRGECGEKTWLMKIAMNTCRDLRRSAWFRHIDRRVTPDMMPMGTLIINTNTAEIKETQIVAGKRWAMTSSTGELYKVECPRFPVNSSPIYFRYWMI